MKRRITLRAARVNAGYTLKTASKALGKDSSTLQHWETGINPIKVEDLDKMSKLYGWPKNDIILPTRYEKSGLYTQGG